MTQNSGIGAVGLCMALLWVAFLGGIWLNTITSGRSRDEQSFALFCLSVGVSAFLGLVAILSAVA
jgi:hypothetical protein